MADKEIKTRVTIEGDDAVRELQKISREQNEYKRSTKEVGEQAESTSKKTGLLSSAFGGMVTQFLGFAAIAGAVVKGITDIGRGAKEALADVVALGNAMRGLSANIGGKQAQELIPQINQIAQSQFLGTEGRAQLIQGVTALTNARPGLTNQQIVGSATNLALLGRATGVGGEQGFNVLQSLQANLGLGEAQAVDVGTNLLNSGYDANAVEQIAARGGNAGGLELVALASAARRTGLSPKAAAEAIPTLIGSLTQRDEQGNLAPSLASLGINDNQSLVQRLAFLDQQRAAGAITQGQFEKATGGAQNARAVAPLVRALNQNLLAPELASLTDPNSAENAVAALGQHAYVLAPDRARDRELREYIAREQNFLRPTAEAHDEFNTSLIEEGGGSWWGGLAHSVLTAGGGTPVGAPPANVTIHNHNYNGAFINGGENPWTAGSDRARLP